MTMPAVKPKQRIQPKPVPKHLEHELARLQAQREPSMRERISELRARILTLRAQSERLFG